MEFYNNQKDSNNTEKKNNKKTLFTVAASGVIGAIVGGMLITAAGLYWLPNSQLFKNSNLYKSLAAAVPSAVQTSASHQGAGKYALLSAETNSSTGTLSVVDIAKKVGPAVVGISTVTNTVETDPFGFPISDGPTQGFGSGIIFSEDGYIVTNYHVVQGANAIKVIFNNKKQASAKLVNYDDANDLAVIKVTDKAAMPGVAKFGDSNSLQVGELAVAIGNPLGNDFLGSVTAGVISAVNREVTIQNRKETFIQTDAAINPGNSGGALVNSRGEVIGINSAKISESGVEGLGFAIPINTVKPKIETLTKQLLTIGITAIDLDKATASQYNLPLGIYVKDVNDFSAAQRAGIKAGDVITKFDGTSVKSVSELNTIKSKHKIGDTVKVELTRESKTVDLNLTFTND